MIAEVIVDIKHLKVNQVFDYFILEKDLNIIEKGMRVFVPFGSQKRIGYVVGIKDDSTTATRDIIEVIDPVPLFNEEFFLIANYLLENPQTIIAKAFETIISNDLLMDYEKEVTIVNESLIPSDIIHKFKDDKWILSNKDLKDNKILNKLIKDKAIKISNKLKERVLKKEEPYVVLNDSSYYGTDKQNIAVMIVKDKGEILKRDLVNETSVYIVNSLISKNVFKVVYKKIKLEYLPNLEMETKDKLNNNLSNNLLVFKNNANKFNYNLFNITDYNNHFLFLIYLLDYFLKENKQVLLLIPEIFLANYYYEKLEKYFNSNLLFKMDSSLTNRQRYLNHQAILDENKGIIIGARSNVFTELNNLGGIIIINGYDSSYISEEGIYYDTNEIAIIRAKYHDVPFINLTNHISLKERYLIDEKKITNYNIKNDELNKTSFIVDLKEELTNGNTSMVSNKLNKEINEELKLNNNVLLIMNQKGYAPFVMCRSCSYVPTSPNSDVPLNYVKQEQILRSNVEKYEEPYTKTCPKCGKDTLIPVGVGLERLYEQLKRLYPDIRIVVISKDTISNKEIYNLVNNLKGKEKTIFIGTKMALKTIFSNKVSLIGIMLLEQWLKRPHYKGYEETYQTIKMALNITKEKLVIQTYDSFHEIVKSINNDELFYKNELRRREISKLPPFYKLLQVLSEGSSYLKTYQHSFMIKELASSKGLIGVGPTPSSYLVKRGLYRFLLLIKYKDNLNQELVDFIKDSKEFTNYTTKDILWY